MIGDRLPQDLDGHRMNEGNMNKQDKKGRNEI